MMTDRTRKYNLLLFVSLLAVFIATNTVFRRGVHITGDEPHYLLMAKTLLEKGAFDLKESYADRSFYAPIYKGLLDPHVSARSVPPHEYSIHQYGFPLLLAPIVFFARLTGSWVSSTYLYQSLLMAFSALWLLDFLQRQSGLNPRAASFLLLGLFTSLPLLVFSKYIYTEVPAFFIVCLNLALIFRTDSASGRLIPKLLLVCVANAFLPWLHVKYLILCAGFMVAVLLRPLSRAHRTLVLFVHGASVLGMLFFFWTLYGSFSFSAQYQSAFSARYIFHGLVGFLVDQRIGLFPNAPIYLLLLPASFFWLKHRRGILADNPTTSGSFLAILLASAAYTVLVTTHTWGGAPMWSGCVIARFILPVLPIGICLVGDWLHIRGMGAISLTLAAISTVFGFVVTIYYPHTLFLYGGAYEDGNAVLLKWSSYHFDLRRLLPNLLSVERETPNLISAILLLGAVFAVTLAVMRGQSHRRLLAALLAGLIPYCVFMAYNVASDPTPKACFIPAIAVTRPAAVFVPPLELMTDLGRKDAGRGLLWTDPKAVNYALAFGPLKLFFRGRYRVNFFLEFAAPTDGAYGDIFIDTARGRGRRTVVYDSKKIGVRSLHEGSNDVSLEFYHDQPTYPLEFRVFVGGTPVPGLALRGVEVQYLGPERDESPSAAQHVSALKEHS